MAILLVQLSILNQKLSKQLLSLSRKENNARKRMRLLAVSMFFAGETRSNIAKRLNTARASVNKWVSNYLAEGLDALDNKTIQGRPSRLSASQKEEIAKYIKDFASQEHGGRLTGEDIATYIYQEFQIQYHPDHIYRLLKKLGFSWITSRSRHPKQDPNVQDAFKKLPFGNDPSHSWPPTP